MRADLALLTKLFVSSIFISFFFKGFIHVTVFIY